MTRIVRTAETRKGRKNKKENRIFKKPIFTGYLVITTSPHKHYPFVFAYALCDLILIGYTIPYL